jgi:molybdopterin-binding protein
MELLKLPEAARWIGVSYPTLKQWIYRGQVKSIKTPGGHHRIPRSELERLTQSRMKAPRSTAQRSALDSISGRNKLLGVVTQVIHDGLLSQVIIDVGGQSITSIITRRASKELGLKRGVPAYALIKATEVMVIRG